TEPQDVVGPDVAQPLRDVHRLVPEPESLLSAAKRSVLVDKERLDAAQIPQRAFALESLRRPQARRDAVEELRVPEVVDRLHMEHVSERSLVANLFGESARLVKECLRLRG